MLTKDKDGLTWVDRAELRLWSLDSPAWKEIQRRVLRKWENEWENDLKVLKTMEGDDGRAEGTLQTNASQNPERT